ncbi:MAG: NusA N-terminal domain-containing protein [Akkermansia sp.]
MTNDIKALIDYYEREKGLSREKILLALESAFLSAYRKMVPGSGSINYLRAEINVDKGKVRIFADLEVVPDEEYSDKFNQIPLSLAVKLDKNAVLHDLLPPTSRRRALAASRCRLPARPCSESAGCGGNADEFKDRADLVTGTIRRFEKGDIFVDLGKFEGVMTSR